MLTNKLVQSLLDVRISNPIVVYTTTTWTDLAAVVHSVWIGVFIADCFFYFLFEYVTCFLVQDDEMPLPMDRILTILEVDLHDV